MACIPVTKILMIERGNGRESSSEAPDRIVLHTPRSSGSIEDYIEYSKLSMHACFG